MTIGRVWYRCSRCGQLTVNVVWINDHPYGPTCAEIIRSGPVALSPRSRARRPPATPVHW